jgi:ubiquinone/menaquinone biosynthesis C-methylase UbiE
MERGLTTAISERMLDLADLKPGMRVIDIATGRGEPAVRAARRVGATGCVVGVDVSVAMLTMTRERANIQGLSNLDLHVGSANSLPFGMFDVGLCRWGLMYMEDPITVLKALSSVLKPGALFVTALWAEPDRVQFVSLPRRVLARYISLPETDFEAPGPFRYSQIEKIRRDFAAAGFRIKQVEEHETAVVETETSDELLDWVATFVLERFIRDATFEVRLEWEADFLNELNRIHEHHTFRLGGFTRVVVAAKSDDLECS